MLMARVVGVLGLALSVAAVSVSPAQAGSSSAPSNALVDPSGLGPNYSGPVRAGLGITRSGTTYGFRAGEFVIQPRFLFENEFSSNFFKIDTRNTRVVGGEEVEVPETTAFTFHLRPGVAISNPNATTIKMSLKTDLDVMLPASDDDRVTDQTNLGLVADAGVTYTIPGLLSFGLKEVFRRELLVRPLSAAGGNSNRNMNRLGLDVTFHPGGGALEFELGYTWAAVLYDSLSGLDDHTHQLRFMSSWKFLPLNYLFIESTLGIQSYSIAQTQDELNTVGNRNDGTPLKVYAGFSGYLTNRIALSVRVGYGNSLLSAGEDFSSFIGDARISFRFTERTALHVGGGRNFDLAGLGGYLDVTRAYLSFEQSFGDVVLLHADFGMNYQLYGAWAPADVYTETPSGAVYRTCTRARLESEEDVTVNETQRLRVPGGGEPKRAIRRQDYVLSGGVLADFSLTRIFGLSVGYRLVADITDFGVEAQTYDENGDPVDAALINYQGYTDHRVFLTLNLRY